MPDTTKGLRGLTFQGALAPNVGTATTLDSLRRTGNMEYELSEPELRFRRAVKETGREDELLRAMARWYPSRNQMMQSQREAFLTTPPYEEMGLEAAAAGFGESRFDKRATSPMQLEDLENFRAAEQSTLGVLGNSIAKMGVLAATTAADSWVGLPAGLINLVSESTKGNVDSFREAFDAFVSNPVSSYLQSINEKSEEIFRNYQTAEERSRHWWENMFTANFIGDTLIKNAGFTIGAVLGARASVGALGKLTGVKEARDAFKGLAAELGLSGKSMSEVAEQLAKGATSLEKQATVKALAQSANKLKRAELGLQIAGGLLAGTGEARIEALNAASEYEKSLQEVYGDLDMERAKAYRRIQMDMVRRGIDPESEEGRRWFERQTQLIDESYNDLREKIAHDKATVANTVFALNVPLLTVGDMVQWGKTMLGGYALDRGLVKGIKKAAESTAARAAAKTPKELIDATRYAKRTPKMNDFFGKLATGSRNVLIEMQEEMNQSWFSETAKSFATGSTTEFMERLYDPRAVVDTVSWLDATKEGLRRSWLNKDDWVEGFAGGFMGFLGLPSISVRVNEEGKRTPKLTMEGGIWSPLRERKDMYERRTRLVNELNNRLSSPEFANYYYGEIGRRYFDSVKEESIDKGDEFLYEKADHAQLINDAIMFAKAGRLQDFIDIIESFENASDATLEQIRSLFPGSDDIQTMLPHVMREHINKSVNRMKQQLDEFIKISDSLKVLYGDSISDAQIAEMTWQTARIDFVERAMKDIISDPDMTGFLSAYRAEHAERTKELTDHEVVSSDGFINWLNNKKNNPRDTDDKGKIEAAYNNAKKAKRYWDERPKYIDNLTELSNDPQLMKKWMERKAKAIELQRQREKFREAAIILSTSDRLSDFVSAMDEFGEVSDVVLETIKNEADRGNKIAEEYLKVRDIDSIIENSIRIAGGETATEDQIRQAMKAWKYFMLNSDTAFDLISEHAAKEVSPDIASPEAIALLNSGIKEANKKLKFFDTIKKREVGKKGPARSGEGTSGGTSTVFKTTGEKLTSKKFDEICDHIRAYPLYAITHWIRFDLELGNFLFDGKPASGVVYGYFKEGKLQSPDGRTAYLPVLYDGNGNEIDPEDVAKLTGPDGQSITKWMQDRDFPINSRRQIRILTDKQKQEAKAVLPVDRKVPKKKKSDSPIREDGKDPGSKSNPHKFIAPNMDVTLLGGDSHAVAEVLKSLSNGAEIRFGMEEKDGPIYLLAGDSNTKIGTLPKEVEGSDHYSGLAELEALIRKEFEESEDRRNADGMWISEKYVNHMREKRNTGFETTSENIPLGDIPNFDKIREPILMFVTNDGDRQVRYFSSPDIRYEDVARQISRQSSDVLTSGFVYLLVPSGEKYIPVLLFTQNVNSGTLNLRDSETISKGFGKRVSDTIDKVVEAVTRKTGTEKVEAFQRWALNIGKSGRGKITSSPDSLQRLLYFDLSGKKRVQFFIKETCPQHEEWFDDGTVMVINVHDSAANTDDCTPIEVGRMRDDGTIYSVRDQIIDVLEGLKYTTEAGEVHQGPLANIHSVHFVEDAKNLPGRIRELIDSGMFLANVSDFDMEMPSFLMDYWSVSDGKFIRPSHAPAKKPSSGPKVTTRTTKGKGKEKIASFEIAGTEVQYNLSSGAVKIGKGKWFTIDTATDADAKAVKKLRFTKGSDFFNVARALAVIADKYGDSKDAEGKIGDRVLLRRFNSGSDAGFVITDRGGRFMTKDELAKFKAELKALKSVREGEKKSGERERMAAARRPDTETAGEEPEIIPEMKITEDDSEPETEGYGSFEQEIEPGTSTDTGEIGRMETIHNVRQAIEHLKKHAPQYSKFLDYISGISYFDDVLIELVNIVDPRNSKVAGRNILRYRGKEYTDRIVIGRNSLGYQTLMHELVHAFTSVAIKYDSALSEDVRTAMEYLRSSVGKARLLNVLGAGGMYAFSNPNEFVAEFFSNPKLQQLAKEVEMPETVEEPAPGSVFRRIINYIAKAIRSLFRGKSTTLYDKLNETLYSIVDRQVELQETGERVFRTKAEFEAARKKAAGSRVDGVALSTKIPTQEERLDYRYVDGIEGDRSAGVRELVSYPDSLSNPDARLLSLSQLLSPGDEYSSSSGMRRMLRSDNVYEYHAGGESSLIGVKEGDVFIAVRSLPVDSDGSFDILIRNVSMSRMPVILAVAPGDVGYYTSRHMHAVHDGEVEGKVFVANDAFTEADLYSIGTAYRPFADVLDANSRFSGLRRAAYTDAEWEKFSPLEKFHARKCIGI